MAFMFLIRDVFQNIGKVSFFSVLIYYYNISFYFSAEQRAGRVVRENKQSIVVRLYSEKEYKKFQDFFDPLIITSDIRMILLKLASTNLDLTEIPLLQMMPPLL